MLECLRTIVFSLSLNNTGGMHFVNDEEVTIAVNEFLREAAGE